MKSISIDKEIEPRSGPTGGINDVFVTAFISLFGFGLILQSFKIQPSSSKMYQNFKFLMFAKLFDVLNNHLKAENTVLQL